MFGDLSGSSGMVWPGSRAGLLRGRGKLILLRLDRNGDDPGRGQLIEPDVVAL